MSNFNFFIKLNNINRDKNSRLLLDLCLSVSLAITGKNPFIFKKDLNKMFTTNSFLIILLDYLFHFNLSFKSKDSFIKPVLGEDEKLFYMSYYSYLTRTSSDFIKTLFFLKKFRFLQL